MVNPSRAGVSPIHAGVLQIRELCQARKEKFFENFLAVDVSRRVRDRIKLWIFMGFNEPKASATAMR